MALSASSSSIQRPSVPSYSLLEKLEKGFGNKEVIVRVIHFWEARNPRKGGLLMGIELLLIDEKSTVIQGFIDANGFGVYERALKADAIYKIKNFLVVDNKAKFKIASHKFILKFTKQTRIEEVTTAGISIEKQQFRIRSYTEFESIADLDEDLYDVIGKIILINYDNFTYPEVIDKTIDVAKGVFRGKLEIHLQLQDGSVVRLFLWDKIAANFQKKLMISTIKPTVLLATGVYSRTSRDGMLTLSSTSTTRTFFDNDVEPTTQLLTWLGESGNSSNMVNNFTEKVTKSETVTLAELYQFLESDIPKKATFCCIVTVTDILPHYGWNYIACTKCACKLGRTDSALFCRTCNNNNAVGIVRYRVELSVSDKDNIATFIVFDRDAAKLTNMRAADVLEGQLQGNDGGVIENQSSIPQCLLDIVGHTFKFQVTLTPYNFTAARQTITVTRIVEEINDGNKAPQQDINGGDGATQEEVNGGNNSDDPKNLAITSETTEGNSDSEEGGDEDLNHRAKRIRRQ